ncbi:MAG: Hsp20/alpha crystallin family protein [Verrucomicrobiota bacterium]|nr:Hsp20/alpha crystallin family protein [Verrucomicrobiota bacterium]
MNDSTNCCTKDSNSASAQIERTIRPSYEVTEREQSFEVRVYLPGVAKSGVEIHLEGDQLTVTGTRSSLPPATWRPLSREIRAENYKLRLQLNVDVDADKIVAATDDGVLTLSLPKAETAKPRSIRVD